MPGWLRHSSGQDTKRLMMLLWRETMENGTPINYNGHKLQGPETSTCGRWCALRIWLSHLPNNQFYRVVKDTARSFMLTPDEMVAEAVRPA